MNSNFKKSLDMLLKHEGGFVHHPLDKGGMTNLGITQAVWENYIGKPCTEADMRALTPEMVAPLYKKNYWDKVRGDDLPAGISDFDRARIFEMRLSLKMTVNEISRTVGINEKDVLKILNNPVWRVSAIRKNRDGNSNKRKHRAKNLDNEVDRNEVLETRIIGGEAERIWADRMGSLRWDIKRPDWAIPQT